jgi:peptidoglycan/LPS O-acetylase OafA/YrhL
VGASDVGTAVGGGDAGGADTGGPAAVGDTGGGDTGGAAVGGGGTGGRHRRTTAADGSRLPSLTGLRFLAAFLVFCFHVSIAGLFGASGPEHAFHRAVGAGAVGVSFFFILSGFVLTWSARTGDTRVRFWRRRGVKIYPNYVFAWLAALVGLAVTGHPAGVRTALANLFLVQSWWPGRGVYFGVNSVSWSLSCEAFFYLLFPWLLPLLARIRPAQLWRAAAVCAAGTIAAPAVALLLPADGRYWFVYVFPPVRLLEFVLGILMALIVKEGRWPRVPVWPAGLLLVVAYTVTPYFPGDAEPVAVTLIPFALLIPAVACADLAGRRSVWAARPVVWLGEVSFAFYLIHQSVIVDLLRAWGVQGVGPARAVGVALAALGLSVAVAAAMHRFIEVPLMRRFGSARSAAPNPAPVPSTSPG